MLNLKNMKKKYNVWQFSVQLMSSVVFKLKGHLWVEFVYIERAGGIIKGLTCGEGSCVVAEVSPTATHVDNDRDEASKRNRGA